MKRGFVIFYAVLLVSIVLVISLSLFTITYKQLLVTQVNRQSQVVFYAADSGIDCAKYWDKIYPITHRPLDSANSAFGFYGDTGNTLQLGTLAFTCEGGTLTGPTRSPDGHTTEFQVEYNTNNASQGELVVCADVTVEKKDDPSGGNLSHTSIRSDGYDVPCSQISNISSSPRRVQRSLSSYYISF